MDMEHSTSSEDFARTSEQDNVIVEARNENVAGTEHSNETFVPQPELLPMDINGKLLKTSIEKFEIKGVENGMWIADVARGALNKIAHDFKLPCAIKKSVGEANYSRTASHASGPATRKRERQSSRSITPEEKLQAILRVRNGEPKAAVGRSIGVAESTLRGWCKSESKIRDQVQKHASQAGLSFADNAIPSTSSANNLPHNIFLPVMDTSDAESVVPAKKARMEHFTRSTATKHSVTTAGVKEINNRIRMHDLFQNSSQYENLMIESCMYTLDHIMPGWQRMCAVALMSNLHSMLPPSQKNE